QKKDKHRRERQTSLNSLACIIDVSTLAHGLLSTPDRLHEIFEDGLLAGPDVDFGHHARNDGIALPGYFMNQGVILGANEGAVVKNLAIDLILDRIGRDGLDLALQRTIN